MVFVLLNPQKTLSLGAPAAPAPWFNKDIIINKTTPPPSIEVISSSVPSDTNLYSLSFVNKGSDPFYFLESVDQNRRYLAPNTELPIEYLPRYKLTTTKVYEYYEHDDGRWFELNNYGNHGLPVWQAFKIKQSLKFEGGEKLSGSGRPKDIQIPNPVSVSASAFYQGKLITIRGIVTYSLNNDYNNNYRDQGFYYGFNKTKLIYLFLIAVISCIVLVGIYYAIRKFFIK